MDPRPSGALSSQTFRYSGEPSEADRKEQTDTIRGQADLPRKFDLILPRL